MNANNNKKKEDLRISMSTISKQLDKVLDEMRIITEEIQEMKDREGGEHGDN